jgi:hypothetical protein
MKYLPLFFLTSCTLHPLWNQSNQQYDASTQDSEVKITLGTPCSNGTIGWFNDAGTLEFPLEVKSFKVCHNQSWEDDPELNKKLEVVDGSVVSHDPNITVTNSATANNVNNITVVVNVNPTPQDSGSVTTPTGTTNPTTNSGPVADYICGSPNEFVSLNLRDASYWEIQYLTCIKRGTNTKVNITNCVSPIMVSGNTTMKCDNGLQVNCNAYYIDGRIGTPSSLGMNLQGFNLDSYTSIQEINTGLTSGDTRNALSCNLGVNTTPRKMEPFLANDSIGYFCLVDFSKLTLTDAQIRLGVTPTNKVDVKCFTDIAASKGILNVSNCDNPTTFTNNAFSTSCDGYTLKCQVHDVDLFKSSGQALCNLK